jgi:hypothetical protein
MGGEPGVRDQKGRTDPAHDGHRRGLGGDHRTESGDARNDQYQIGHRAGQDDRQHMLAAQSLAQDEGVLRADGDDEHDGGGKTGQGGTEHVPILRWSRPGLQLKILHFH